MTITWSGKTCIVVETDSGRAIFNPPGKDTGLKIPKGPFDLIMFSDPVPAKSDWKDLVGKDTVVIENPGEWDHRGFFVLALSSGSEKPEPNVFLVEQERKVIAHIASYKEEALTEEDFSQVENVDILAISVGGENGKNIKDEGLPIDADRAMKIANQIEPKIILPMDFKTKNHKEKRAEISKFLKEAGATGTEEQNKFTIKKNSSISDEETEIILLKP